jgi:hypothetical protein
MRYARAGIVRIVKKLFALKPAAFTNVEKIINTCLRIGAVVLAVFAVNPERDQIIEGTARSDIGPRRVILRLFANPAKGLSRCLPGFAGNAPSLPERKAHPCL